MWTATFAIALRQHTTGFIVHGLEADGTLAVVHSLLCSCIRLPGRENTNRTKFNTALAKRDADTPLLHPAG